MNEDLVQLDDDDEDEDNDIPLPPGPEPEAVPEKVNDDLYEPENPTDEPDEADANEKSNSDGVPMEESESSDNEGGDSNSRVVVSRQPEPVDEEEEETKTRSTPSPAVKEDRVADRDRAKGVLELYDDSDWEELDIDKPKEFEKALDTGTDVEAAATSKPAASKKAASKKDGKAERDENASGSDVSRIAPTHPVWMRKFWAKARRRRQGLPRKTMPMPMPAAVQRRPPQKRLTTRRRRNEIEHRPLPQTLCPKMT